MEQVTYAFTLHAFENLGSCYFFISQSISAVSKPEAWEGQ